MMQALRSFWIERTDRERQLLTVMLVLFAIVVLWFGIVRPLADGLIAAEARLDRASVESGQVASRAEALKRASRGRAPALGTTLALAVGQAGSNAGFTLSRLDAQGDDRLIVAVPAAKSPALFSWLNGLARKGIFVEKIAVRPNSDATLAVDATLRVRRP